jgi:prepilin-type N-terminal cleavage/methylation domain-containing protein/prepilin-type processing-associated H-X9-DG protein
MILSMRIHRYLRIQFLRRITASSWRRGFSLAELLVVVAMISVVAALLLPALSGTKTSAQKLRCVSSLHQLGLAAHLYWDENGGQCFRYNGAPTNYGQVYWFGWIGPGAEGQRDFDLSQGALYPYVKGRGVEICPSLNYSLAQFKLKTTGAAYGYGYNRFLSGPTREPALKISRVMRPADLALLADAAQVNVWQAPASLENPMLEEWYYVDTSADQPNGHFRHSRKGNAAFCDGHVGSESFVAGSVDPRLPSQFVGRLRNEILEVP